MKKIIEYKAQIDKELIRLEDLYGLEYLSISRDSISATKGTASLHYASYMDEPNITKVCSDENTPETYEEFEELKTQHEEDTAHLKRIAAIWRDTYDTM